MIVFFVCGDSPHLAFMAVSHVYKKNSTRLKPLPLLIKFHCTYTHTLYHTFMSCGHLQGSHNVSSNLM